ncbi:MAG: 23S rRNA (adenine(2503)-C(2))-methyltransferase RlmN [Actinobacteria bacterium]|nr:23S rRNA (adenine(2503)-C(2))-methyltransferase RlmN [Actinomycetota bacterium]
MASAYELTRDELTGLLAGEPKYRVDQIWQGIWEQDRFPEEITTISKALREKLTAELPLALEVANDVSTDEGTTRKWVYRLHDGYTIETVLMNYEDRVTVCISTQAGCAMGCTFCATGQAGFSRQLTLGEVVEQVVRAGRAAAPRRISNIVFMGMGEPLANYDVTVGTIRALHHERGLSARNLTVSTVGIAPAIERLALEGLPLTLAISLHVANDAERDELIPINKRYNLERLYQACEVWRNETGRRISFEWALISGVNDTDQALYELAEYARPLGAHVNLIPLNPTPGFLVIGSPAARVRYFRDELEELGVNATVRRTRGRTIDAACGQLANVTNGKRRSIPVR